MNRDNRVVTSFCRLQKQRINKTINVECTNQEQQHVLELTLPSRPSLQSSSLSSVPSLYFKHKTKILIESNICTIDVINPKTVMKVKGQEDHNRIKK